jgi:ribA/ribD-fused uncharacterized protein
MNTCPYCATGKPHPPAICAVFSNPSPITSFQGSNRFLSNFWPAKVVFEGVEYPSVENAYQAAKTLDPSLRVPFQTYTAGEAKKQSHKLKVREDWNEVKLNVMRDLLLQKFRDKDLLEELKRTGTKLLIEGNIWHDNFWGDCSCGKRAECAKTGMNHLGQLLMAIRNGTPTT